MLLHAADHRGYFPFAGDVHDQTGQLLSSGAPTPSVMLDTYSSHYCYISYNSTYPQVIAPMPVALARYCGGKLSPDVTTATTDLASNTGITRLFLCPSQSNPPATRFIADGVNTFWNSLLMKNSYMFNETLLGSTDATFNSSLPAVRYWGRQSAIRRPSETALLSDGQPRNESGTETVTMYNLQSDTSMSSYAPSRPATVGDAMRGVGRDPNQANWYGGNATEFDPIRHQNRINILFVDGHVESLWMYQNPMAYKLGAVGTTLPMSLLPAAGMDRVYLDPPGH